MMKLWSVLLNTLDYSINRSDVFAEIVKSAHCYSGNQENVFFQVIKPLLSPGVLVVL